MMCPKCGCEIKDKMELEAPDDLEPDLAKKSVRGIEMGLLDNLMQTMEGGDLGNEIEIIVSKKGKKKQLEDV